MKRLRVCVIGAGAAGLAAARHLTSQLNAFDVSVFEQASCIGGTWVYNENTGRDEHGLPIHSSMYRNLRTNLPKEVMAFPDFPFPSEWPSFLTHQQVLQYLQSYTSHFGLYRYIHFNSFVQSIRPIVNQGTSTSLWEVIVVDTPYKKTSVLLFEAVIVCNGRYSVPFIPEIHGLEHFPGLVMHSHDYRHSKIFQQMNVVIVGAGNSGQDICLEIADCSNFVYLSHKRCLPCKLPDNVKECKPIASVASDGGVQFEDGRKVKVDAILLCTGYEIKIPFLDDNCGIQVRNNRVIHLYKHIFAVKNPTLSFIGLCFHVCPFPLFSLQAQFVTAVLSGVKTLPFEEEMLADEEREFKEKLCSGSQEKYAHSLGERQWTYNRTIAHLAGIKTPSTVCKTLYDHVIWRRTNFLMDYKNDDFRQIKG